MGFWPLPESGRIPHQELADLPGGCNIMTHCLAVKATGLMLLVGILACWLHHFTFKLHIAVVSSSAVISGTPVVRILPIHLEIMDSPLCGRNEQGCLTSPLNEDGDKSLHLAYSFRQHGASNIGNLEADAVSKTLVRLHSSHSLERSDRIGRFQAHLERFQDRKLSTCNCRNIFGFISSWSEDTNGDQNLKKPNSMVSQKNKVSGSLNNFQSNISCESSAPFRINLGLRLILVRLHC